VPHVEQLIRAEDGAEGIGMLEAAARLHAKDDLVDVFRGGIDPVVDKAGILLTPEVARHAGIGDVARPVEDGAGGRLVAHGKLLSG
jgi:hypothetical protein